MFTITTENTWETLLLPSQSLFGVKEKRYLKMAFQLLGINLLAIWNLNSFTRFS